VVMRCFSYVELGCTISITCNEQSRPLAEA
jgi:hypothetical protein